jgi:hypothetical protein
VESSEGGNEIDQCSYDQYYRNLENLRKFSQKNPNLQSFTLYIVSYKSYLKPDTNNVSFIVEETTATLDQFFKDNQIYGWTEEK